jgi:hypothetical protein
VSQETRTCASCGSAASWLVTWPYGGSTESGRILIYCDDCRRGNAETFAVVLPARLLDEAPALVMTLLYEHGLSESDPDLVAEMIGVPRDRWRLR